MTIAARSMLVSLAAAALLPACREPLKCQAPTKTCGELCCPAPEHGAATCDGAVCGFTCEAGFHPAGGACASDTSVTSCGAAGADCTAGLPTHSSAVCAGDPPVCGFGCGAGYHKDGVECADDETPTSCGPVGADCTTGLPAHASATCDGMACDFDCAGGYHKGGGECVDDETLTSCGAAASDCNTEKPANSTATCNGTSCGFDCDSDYHKVSTSCVGDDTVTSCGPSGTNCTSGLTAHATASCDGTSCGFECNGGYHRTGATCTDDDTVTSCGASGADCTSDLTANAAATCNGVSCGFDCNSDFHKTGATCTANATVTSCGAAASDCNTEKPANSTATCSGTSCGFDCVSTYHKTGATCTANTTLTSCGAAASDCATEKPANATATCNGVSCGFDCNSDFHKTGASCTADTTVSSCGAVASDCNTEKPANSTATCDGAACGFECNTDYCEVGAACSSIQTDAQNCGGCGHGCPGPGAVCAGGKCVKTDPDNCGTAGYECPGDATCSGGACACAGGATVCGADASTGGGACVSTQTDADNCGTCGHVCPSSTPRCVAGQCLALACGTTAGGAAPSCRAVRDACGSTDSAVYWIKDSGDAPSKAYCDMTTRGGGWTLCASVVTSDADHYYGREQFPVAQPGPDVTHSRDCVAMLRAINTEILGVNRDQNEWQHWRVVIANKLDGLDGAAVSDAAIEIVADSRSQYSSGTRTTHGFCNWGGCSGQIRGYAAGDVGSASIHRFALKGHANAWNYWYEVYAGGDRLALYVRPACGESSSAAAGSCRAIRDNCGAVASGLYWVTAGGAAPFQVYCDMAADDGGWMLFAKIKGDADFTWTAWSAGELNPADLLAPAVTKLSHFKLDRFDGLGNVHFSLRQVNESGRRSFFDVLSTKKISERLPEMRCTQGPWSTINYRHTNLTGSMYGLLSGSGCDSVVGTNVVVPRPGAPGSADMGETTFFSSNGNASFKGAAEDSLSGAVSWGHGATLWIREGIQRGYPDSPTAFCSNSSSAVACSSISDGQSYYGQDGHHRVSVPTYVTVGENTDTVLDTVTGLTWQRAFTLDPGTYLGGLAYCDTLTTGGYLDWRLPTRLELLSIIDYGLSTVPFLDTVAFQFDSDYRYRSSTRAIAGGSWGVSFSGVDYWGYVDSASLRVRCVRGASPPAGPYTVTSNTVFDHGTGLMWQRAPSPADLGWAGALDYCETLDLASFQDWRLPSVKELETIVDVTRIAPAIDLDLFPGTPSSSFRSSTANASSPASTWGVNFSFGNPDGLDQSGLKGVRCVR